ncbi:MAG: valine--tRNA ligase [Pseudomonadota bacterium]
MLPKTYQPADIESRITNRWASSDAFRCARPGVESAAPYTIVIPPPNVTGSLHMGHALNNTLQDILCRFERMRGCDVLWQPGTDHAGIATQMVVERQMAERQEPDRRTIGREKFLEKVWDWKAESGDTITTQLKRLGASCDWSRERFTMDDGLSRAVLKVFVALYEEGLIYKDQRLVNWDPKFQTAISDLEVEQVESKGSLTWEAGDPEAPFSADALAKALKTDASGHMYHFRYPLKDGETVRVPVAFDGDGAATEWDERDYIVVATTRPETMLGDTAVAVHPDDERYKSLIGKTVILPLVGREIPIVGDEYSDPEKGSGAVKITPAHDFNDFEVGKRHDLEMINVLDAYGAINDVAPDKYRGMDRFEARKAVVADIAALDLLERIEPTTHTVPHGDRSNVPIEPFLTDQWYVDAETLAKPAIEAVEGGRTKFVPQNWEKTYFEWMRNIQPWCISRQLWWGHQIPAWYGPDGKVFVALTEAEAFAAAEQHYGSAVELRRDEDVLDTWFSSALWPFSTLGWPDDTPEVARYYPTDVLVTGFDIIFFWVARMMMMGLHFKDEVPFHTVYIHALVRDERGQKMSKSKGNVMDPLDLIDGVDLQTLVAKRTRGLMNPKDADKIARATKADYPDGIEGFGADALRFTLAAMAAQGRDVKLSVERIKGYRNFATKLWNAARFAEMNECVRVEGFDPANVEHTINKWIAGETRRTTAEVTAALEAYKFNEAAGAVYEFVWGVFCDWYLELIKPILNGNDTAAVNETRAMVAWTRDEILKLLHPFMPFVTEELWERTAEYGAKRDGLLTVAPWPGAGFDSLGDAAADGEIGWVVRLVSEIRSVRSEMNVPAGAKIPLCLVNPSDEIVTRAKLHGDTIRRLARLDGITFVDDVPKGAAVIGVDSTTAALPLDGVIDMSAERTRLAKEIEKARTEIKKIDAKLDNPSFVAKAPEEVVMENRERRVDFEGQIQRFEAAMKRLDAAA